MPKLYYPSPDEVQWAEPLNELVWFEQYQHLLVKLANTDWGRDLLLIDKHPYPVASIGKNYVRFHLGMWDDQDHYLSDYRIGAKWGNIIRCRWLEVKKAIDRMILLSVLESWHPIYDRQGKLLLPVGGGTTTTVFPDADPESTTVDGKVMRQDEAGGLSFNDVRTGAGTQALPSTVNITTFDISATGEANEWVRIARGIFLFATHTIATTDIISAATFHLYGNDKNSDFTGSYVVMVDSSPASNTALVTADYQQVAASTGAEPIDQAARVAYSAANASGYTDWTLNAAGLATITATKGGDPTASPPTGVSKFGCRDSYDADGTTGPS
jgi:hypothetical protein